MRTEPRNEREAYAHLAAPPMACRDFSRRDPRTSVAPLCRAFGAFLFLLAVACAGLLMLEFLPWA